jgi:hypothetical protein
VLLSFVAKFKLDINFGKEYPGSLENTPKEKSNCG